jgi:hypothetical protein
LAEAASESAWEILKLVFNKIFDKLKSRRLDK